jgi:hypothetical protein
VKDSGDGAMAFRTVYLTGADIFGNSVSLTTQSNSSGYYIFNNVLAGTYTVSVAAPTSTFHLDAANVGTVGGNSRGTANTTTFTSISSVLLNMGDAGINYNFGYIVSNPT